jgi:hypothetical protein
VTVLSLMNILVVVWTALAFLLVYGFGIVGGYYWRLERGAGLEWSWGRRPVLQYFLQAYALALLITLVWIIKSRGFVGRDGAF